MDAVEEIKSRLAVEDVVSEYVKLKRSGRNYKGLSPFTSEKTPSFMVSPEKQIWHDFSSGRGGDMFTFIEEMEGLDFKGALELLARRAGVELEQYKGSKDSDFGKQKERLYEANELAAKFYQAHLKKSQKALNYIFKERKFNKQTVLGFRIGYSPDSGHALLEFMKNKGISEQEMQKAGLITRRYRGSGDMFIGRIQIPLADPQGRIVGFTARLLDERPNAPKYMNTPQTMLYDKGRHVYGLHLAKEGIRKNGYVVVVEGNMDVVASHQAGVMQTVATAGTALTEMQMKVFKRFTSDVRLAFDQDKAGLSAAERAIPIAGKTDVSLKIITLPEGKDPDDLIKKDKKAWQKVIEEPDYAVDWLINYYAGQLDLNSALGKRQFTDVVLGVVGKISDQVEQDHYVNLVAEKIGANKQAVQDKMRQGAKNAKSSLRRHNTPKQDSQDRVEWLKRQNRLLALALFQPPLRSYLKLIDESMMLDQNSKDLLKFLKENPEFSGEVDQEEDLRRLDDYVRILQLQYEELYRGLELVELRDEAARLQARLIEQYVKSQKRPISEAMKTADDADYEKLLKKAKELDELLKRI